MGIISKEKFTASLDSRYALMFAHIFDMAEISMKRASCIYGDFLSENSIGLLLQRKQYLPLEPVLFGGFDDAERQMVAFIPEYDEPDFPIGAVRITSPVLGGLSHRDFLGSVLGLGIKREKCGDIIILENECFVIAHKDIAAFISDNLTKVGRIGVKTQLAELSDIVLPEKNFKPITGTVSAMRLDSVVSLFVGKSRSHAAELIASGYVFVNGIPASKNDMRISDGDTLSVRGYGKAVIEIGGKSKKDRIFVTLNKYS